MLDSSIFPTLLLDRNVFKQDFESPQEMEHRAPNGLAHLLNQERKPAIVVEVNDCRLQVYEENGRYYHAHKRGKYLFPCDSPERDRQDMTHHLIYGILLNHYDPRSPTTLNNGQQRPNPLAGPLPFIYPTRVLDLGCGSGCWTLDAASRFPRALIEGADIAGGQPSSIALDGCAAAEVIWRTPDTGEHNAFDFDEATWCLNASSYDLVHASQLCGSVSDWSSLLRNCYRVLKPGGWLESIEFDFEPCCDDNTLPSHSALSAWWYHMTHATSEKPIAYPSNLPSIFQHEGFQDVQCITIPLPVSPWFYHMQNSAGWIEDKMTSTFAHTGCALLRLPAANWIKNINDASDWLQMMLTNDPSFQGSQVFNGLSMAPFTKNLKWSREQVEQFVPQLMSCVQDRTQHTYFRLHIVIGRKPI